MSDFWCGVVTTLAVQFVACIIVVIIGCRGGKK